MGRAYVFEQIDLLLLYDYGDCVDKNNMHRPTQSNLN